MSKSKCKVISFSNSKGGVAKTTTCHNTGVILAQKGYKVLLVDNDAQAHLTVCMGFKDPEMLLEITLYDLIDMITRKKPITKDQVLSAIIKTDILDLMPTTFNMKELDVALNSISDREYALTDILAFIKDEYDYILIDCNSADNIFTTNALASSDEVIVPTQTQYLSKGGIPLVLSMIKTIQKRINPDLILKGVLATMYDGRTGQSKRSIKKIREDFEEYVFDTVIPTSTKVADAQEKGISVVELDKRCTVSKAYQEFVKELLLNDQ